MHYQLEARPSRHRQGDAPQGEVVEMDDESVTLSSPLAAHFDGRV